MQCLSAALKMGTTLAILSSSGKMLSFIEEFIRCVSGFMNIYQGWGQVQYLYLVLVLKYIFIST